MIVNYSQINIILFMYFSQTKSCHKSISQYFVNKKAVFNQTALYVYSFTVIRHVAVSDHRKKKRRALMPHNSNVRYSLYRDFRNKNNYQNKGKLIAMLPRLKRHPEHIQNYSRIKQRTYDTHIKKRINNYIMRVICAE